MADTDTAPAPTPGVDYNALIQQILQGGGGGVTGPAAPATPAVNPNLPIASLLGEAFGGGVSPLYPMSEAQQTQAGNAALLNFGIGMLQNASGPVRHSLGQAIASGLLGAQGSLAGVREGQAQMLDIQNKQQMMRLEQLKEVLPLLRMQQGANTPNLLMGGGAPGGIAATGAPIAGATPLTGDMAHDLPIIKQRESGGDYGALNYVAKADPSAYDRGATGSGAYQIVNSTWAEGMKLAGLDPSKYATAASAPPAVQDQVAQALYGKYGTKPWDSSQFKQNWVQGADGKYTLQPTGGGKAPPTQAAGMPPAATPPAPAAKPTGAPAAPPGTIQGAPDTGGTLVGGPGALPGKIAPPGPAVPGDVKAIIGGMTGAGASPTTLAPGTAMAGPIAPPVSTVVASNAPTPQQPTQADQPAAPPGKLTFEQFQTQHPIPIDPATYTVTPPDLSALISARNQAARQLDLANRGISGDPNKSLSDYNTAAKAVTDAQAAATTKSLELQQAAQKNALDTQRQLYNDEMTRQQQAELKAQELAQQAAENEKQRAAAVALKAQEGEQAQTLARINAGTELEKGDADQGRKDIENLNTNAQAASNMQSLLGMIGPQLKDLPSATVGAMLQDHPGAIPFLTKLHLLDGPTANATQLLQGLTAFMATEMKPKGLGPLRIQEMNAFQGALPTLLQSDEGRQKAFAFMNAYSQRIMDEADYGQQYFMRDKPNTAPGAPPGSTVPARNTYGMWSSIGKDLGPVLPTYTGGMQTADDAAKYSAWEQQQQAQPGHAYWGLRKGQDGQRHMELQITPPAGG